MLNEYEHAGAYGARFQSRIASEMRQSESPAGQEHRCDFLRRYEKRVDIHELLLTAVRVPKWESII